jgi:hypothetical protein
MPRMKRLVNFELPRPAATASVAFEPAFLDTGTMAIYRSRHADGTPAPYHLLDGLPDAVVWSRAPDGRVKVAKPTLIRGYVRRGFFYTLPAACRALRDWGAG